MTTPDKISYPGVLFQFYPHGPFQLTDENCEEIVGCTVSQVNTYDAFPNFYEVLLKRPKEKRK